MEQEQFVKIKSNINRIIDTINHATLNGRKQLVSKYQPKNSHIKNEIDIPKIKQYNDTVEYTKTQLLCEYAREWGHPSELEQFILNLSIYINCRDDIYNAKFIINKEQTLAYLPPEKQEELLLDEEIQTENLIDFIDNLIKIFGKMSDIEVYGQYTRMPPMNIDNILEEFNIAYRNINEILNN